MRAEGGGTMDRREALRITAVAGVSVALGGGLVSSLLRQARLHRVGETRVRMGTVVTITSVHPDPDEAGRMVSASFDEMERLESLLSRHRPDTPLSRLNETGVLPDAPPELIEVVEKALAYSRITGGAFDVSIKPMLDLYAQAFSDAGGAPTRREIDTALGYVDYRKIDVGSRSLALRSPGMSVTLDGIGKGYIVDRTIDVLVASGADRVLVNAGGDMSSAGKGSAKEPWTVSLQDPRDGRAYVELVRLGGECVATSGDYMRTFTEDRRFHHIIDPRTGYSPEHTSSVSVIAPTAMDADALSTAVLVLGPEAGCELLEGIDGVEGIVVAKDGRQRRTSGLGRHTAPA